MNRILACALVGSLPLGLFGHVSDLPPVSGELAFAPVEGHAAITKHQEALKKSPGDAVLLERLGRLFISTARLKLDDKYYANAEACGFLLGETAAGLLLRGHCLLAAHRFHDAEDVARRLLKLRQEMQDHALLGDALMEQGLLEDALPVYQAMIDAKPCLPSYSRVAHFRWLKGDVEGAMEMAEQAIACGSYRDPEPLAWVTTRLAFYQWQAGKLDLALQTAGRAEQLVAGYAHASFIKGRVYLAKGDFKAAAASLEVAARSLKLPEVMWALEDTRGGKMDEAHMRADGRSAALYLATRGLLSEEALALAKAETLARRDVFTWDAVAWAQLRAGEPQAAAVSARRALVEGTEDARILLHAGLIFQSAGDPVQSAQLLTRARALRFQLLPSEQALLDQSEALFTSNTK
ncbi:MAG: tetratricopeptide repeat protein [Verrucomicrobiaceae bacterium]|nr:tetratricopeptide repeat protein [Verrucomicrobiaceae bacterium]